jgi:hypothetical protein
MFEDSGVFDANLIQAIKAIGILTKPIGGKVYLFEASPISQKYPHLRPTDKPGVPERNELLQATNSLFKNNAQELSCYYVSLDMFVLSSQSTFKNLATLSDLSRYSNGRAYYYPKFDAH